MQIRYLAAVGAGVVCTGIVRVDLKTISST
jgi:hypothetical protein